MGQGGNHVFALDITDPLAPVRSPGGGCGPTNATPANLAALADPIILWEEGDPLDVTEMLPVTDAVTGNVTFAQNPPTHPVDDTAHEGPGFPIGGAGLVQPSTVNNPLPTDKLTFNHYLGKSAGAYMGQVGTNTQQATSFVAGQNGGDDQNDGYGRLITLPPAATGRCAIQRSTPAPGLDKSTGPTGRRAKWSTASTAPPACPSRQSTASSISPSCTSPPRRWRPTTFARWATTTSPHLRSASR